MKLLDCTLRDGGYINNWNFSTDCARTLYQILNRAQFDYIEVGLCDNLKIYKQQFVNVFRRLRPSVVKKMFGPIKNTKDVIKIAVMVNNSTFDLDVLRWDGEEGEECLISMVRLAFHRDELEVAIQNAKSLKEMGYEVTLNAMGSEKYTEIELERLCEAVLEYQIDYLYIADSYGSIGKSKLVELIRYIKNFRKEKVGEGVKGAEVGGIKIGFHGHNNSGLALSNAIVCIEEGVDIIDSTVFGMGRGSGNLATEGLLSLLVKEYGRGSGGGGEGDILELLKFIKHYLLQFNKNVTEFSWGYNIYHVISGHFSVHPNYISAMLDMNITDLDYIWKIIKEISVSPGNKSGKFDKDYLLEMLF